MRDAAPADPRLSPMAATHEGGTSMSTPQGFLRRHIYVVGFIGGALLLTILPTLQRAFLKAPPPVRTLQAWSLPKLGGGEASSEALRGKVWLSIVLPSPCNAACRTRVEAFGRALPHLEGVPTPVALVTYVPPDSVAAVQDLASDPRWALVSAERAAMLPVLEDLRAGWKQWAGTDPGGAAPEALAALEAIALVDQHGQLRGFWRDDAEGRGNAINAARLLARYGAAP